MAALKVGTDDPNGSDAAVAKRDYADTLPQDCPPTAASLASGRHYAAHTADPPDADDFRTAAERNVFPAADECRRRSNSVMANVVDARHLCRVYPDVYRFVSEGVLDLHHGKLLTTPTGRYPSHLSFWRFSGITMHSLFNRIA